jgi:hypothetical protein
LLSFRSERSSVGVNARKAMSMSPFSSASFIVEDFE